MKKILSYLIAGSIALGASGCAGTIPRSFPEGHAHGYDFRDRTQTEVPYKLERAVIHGQQYYIRCTEKKEGQLPWEISYVTDVTRVLDLNSNTLEELKSEYEFVPTKVRVDPSIPDSWANAVILRPSYSQETGVRGIRAHILTQEQLRRREGVSRKNYGWSGVTSEEDAKYGIRTANICRKRHFLPHVEASKMHDHARLPFYPILENEGKLEIEEYDGQITIRNTSNIYRPVLKEIVLKELGLVDVQIHSGRELFGARAACPNCSYYEINGKGFKEYPSRQIEFLNPEQIAEVRKSLERIRPQVKEVK